MIYEGELSRDATDSRREQCPLAHLDPGSWFGVSVNGAESNA